MTAVCEMLGCWTRAIAEPGPVPSGWRRVRVMAFDGSTRDQLVCPSCLRKMGFKPEERNG